MTMVQSGEIDARSDSLDSKISEDDSVYSGVGDLEFEPDILEARKTFKEEFTKIKQLPLDQRTEAYFKEQFIRFRTLILNAEYSADVTGCVLALLDPRWMSVCLDEYPAYGIPLDAEVKNFAPYFLRTEFREYPDFIQTYISQEMKPKEVVPFFLDTEEEKDAVKQLLESSYNSITQLMNVVQEKTYMIGTEFRGVVGLDRGRRVGVFEYPILLPTSVFGRTLLLHTDACQGEIKHAGPFPSFLIRKDTEYNKTRSARMELKESNQGLVSELEMLNLSAQQTRERALAQVKKKKGSSLCIGRPDGKLKGGSKEILAQLVDTHSLTEGVVLVGPAIMSALKIQEGEVIILKQLFPKQKKWFQKS